MPEPIVIVGCGGHGREVLGIIHAINESHGDPWKPLGFVDDTPSHENLERVRRHGVPHLGPVQSLQELNTNTRYVIGIGTPQVRKAVDAKITKWGLRAAVLVHPSATVGTDTVIGDGGVVFAGARVTTNVTLGRHVHLNQNVTVGHDTVLSDYVSVNPLAAVSGECRVGPSVLVGAGATVLQGIDLEEECIVGAGACVVRRVARHTVVKGVPAR